MNNKKVYIVAVRGSYKNEIVNGLNEYFNRRSSGREYSSVGIKNYDFISVPLTSVNLELATLSDGDYSKLKEGYIFYIHNNKDIQREVLNSQSYHDYQIERIIKEDSEFLSHFIANCIDDLVFINQETQEIDEIVDDIIGYLERDEFEERL